MDTIVIELQCFGSFYYWVSLINSSYVIFEQCERFQKQGKRNRYEILGANGVQTLSIPIEGGRESKNFIREIRIDERENWRKKHWRAIESCYNKSPFFLYYRDSLKVLFTHQTDSLWDFNLLAMDWCLTSARLKLNHSFSEKYVDEYGGEMADLRNREKKANTTMFQQESYFQVFGNKFHSNLSFLDILFNLGPETESYIKRQTAI